MSKLFIIIFIFLGCVSRNSQRMGFFVNVSNIYLVDQVSQCKYVKKITTSDKIWAADLRDKTEAELIRLKAVAQDDGVNSIHNIIMTDLKNPTSEADGYDCPQSVLSEVKELQNDQKFKAKLIQIKLSK